MREPQDFKHKFTKEHYKRASKAIIGIKVSLGAVTIGRMSLVCTCTQQAMPHEPQCQCMISSLCSACQGRLQGLLRRLMFLSSPSPAVQCLMSKPILSHQKHKNMVRKVSIVLLSCRCKCIRRA